MMYDLIEANHGKRNIEQVINSFEDEEEKMVVKKYFDFSLENEIIYIVSENLKSSFPAIELNFDIPCKIANAIINLHSIDASYLSDILNELVKLKCLAVEITCKAILLESEIKELITICKNVEIDDFAIMISFAPNIDYQSLFLDMTTLSALTIFNSPENFKNYSVEKRFVLRLSTDDLSDHKFCGAVNQNLFIPELNHFAESQSYNTCLNRKVTIDFDGSIKNCPSMVESFGNIVNTTLAGAIEKPGFKKYWQINKDEINVCKDCEFRHICTDCRAYVENPSNAYSKPLKCGYDPYSCEWQEWSNYTLKQVAINHYGLK